MSAIVENRSDDRSTGVRRTVLILISVVALFFAGIILRHVIWPAS